MRKLKKRYVFITIVLASLISLCLVRWHAWFDMPPEPKWEGPIRDYVFPSMADAPFAPDQDLTILVLGDIHSNLTLEDYNAIADQVPNIDGVVQTGDWMQWGQNYYYQLLIQEWLPSQLHNKPVLVCPGNHEYNKGLIKERSEFWDHAFPHPNNGPAVPGATYYVDVPGIRFIVIDTNPIWRLTHFTRLMTWINHLVKEADGRFVVAVMHHPVISAAKGRFNPLIYSFCHRGLSKTDLVLAGHDHSYMRREPFVILNTAGDLKRQRPSLRAEEADTAAVYGVIRTHITDHTPQMTFTVYRLRDHSVVDSIYVKHH